MPVETVHEAAIREEDSVRYERVKKKGKISMSTYFVLVYRFVCTVVILCDVINLQFL